MQNRIKEAREQRKLYATQLAEKLQVHPSMLNNWEAGRRRIPSDKLVQMAELLGYSIDYLLGRESLPAVYTEPVDKKALPALHGQAVWTARHGWMLVNIGEKAFVLSDLSLIPFDEVNQPIYTIQPSMAYSLRGVGAPLCIEKLLNAERVWVEPVTSDTELAAGMRGWYFMYEKRLVQNEFGNRFYLDNYGVRWLAFESCQDK